MTTTPPLVFFTGATGYLGGTILQRLLDNKDSIPLRFKALVRSVEKAAPLEAQGVHVIIGSLTDVDLLERECCDVSAVISTADSDDVAATAAILRGLKKRKENTGHMSMFVHTSGTGNDTGAFESANLLKYVPIGVLADDAKGMFAGAHVYDDSKPEDIESLAPSAIHRPVDLAIVAADMAGDVLSYIIVPGDVYGSVSGPFINAKIQHPLSMKVPRVIMASLDRGSVPLIGNGKNIWPCVSISDTVDFFELIVRKLIVHEDIPHGREGFYFLANGEYSSYEMQKAIAASLFKLGALKTAEPTAVVDSDYAKYPGIEQLGTNARCIPSHAKALGWAPTKTTKNFLERIISDAQAIVESLN